MSAPGLLVFELDLMKAVLGQLVPRLELLDDAPLVPENARQLPDAQGVYLLCHAGMVKYVGKTDAKAGLRSRLVRHVYKFQHRKGIAPADVSFKAAQILVLTAMDIETELMTKFGGEWNGSGFGANDPGRERETTNKPAEGFDAQFPINIDIPGQYVPAGRIVVADLLWQLKDALPYTLRYETLGRSGQAYKTRPHDDYRQASVDVPSDPISVRELLRLVVSSLPDGWKATEFASHVILYKEVRSYVHGRTI